jgi:GMP synthase (glutamine-hydrolysing)
VSSPLLVLQHIACEPPAAFEEELRSRGLELVRVELDEEEAIPERDDFAGIVVMGGPTANADTTLPLARRLFGRWLERVVRVPAHSIG